MEILPAILNLVRPARQAEPTHASQSHLEQGSGNGQSTQDSVEITPIGRQAFLLYHPPGREEDSIDLIDQFINLSGRETSRLFGLERRADPQVLEETLASVAQLLQQGIVGYETRRYNNRSYKQFISTSIAPGGPYGRPELPERFQTRER
jgi:hypothetical protein